MYQKQTIMTQDISINTYSFLIEGLTINYRFNGVSNLLKLDPCATCNLFEDMHIIEGFDLDNNGEPVILFTNQNATGFCFWAEFVKSYPFTQRHAEILAANNASTYEANSIIARIDRLLKNKAA